MITSSELDRGEKPEYFFFPFPTKVKRRCKCGDENYHHMLKHGYEWEVEWNESEIYDLILNETQKYLEFWGNFLIQLRKYGKDNRSVSWNQADIEWLIRVNLNRVTKWQDIEKQILHYKSSLDGSPSSEGRTNHQYVSQDPS